MSRNGISTKQRRAIRCLLTSRTIEEAATCAQVATRTIHRWLSNDDQFKAELARAEAVLVGSAVRRLAQLAELSLTTIEAVLVSDSASHQAALRASDMVLSHLARLRDIAELEERIERLEALIDGNR
ncbi:MAG: hypothetical protein ACYTEQ_19205 [Planctomycetota bacterium]